MTDTLFKHISIEEKDIDDDNRTITAIGSKEVIDRDGDIIKIGGIDTKDFKKNPVVLFAHNNHELPVGKATKVWKSGDELKFKIQFATAEENPKAENVFKLYKGGFMKSFSIGFIPDNNEIEFPQEQSNSKSKKLPWRIFHKISLLELSCVPVPANQDALVASFQKAWEDGVLDTKEDLRDMNDMCKNIPKIEEIVEEIVEEVEETVEPVTIEKCIYDGLVKKVIELEQKLADIEQTKEIEVDKDDWLTKLFEEFEASAPDQEAHDDLIEEDEEDFDTFLENKLGDKKDDRVK